LEYDHATAGKVKVPGNPLKFSAYEAIAELPPPFKGQHTTDILKELGYNDADIAKLLEAGVIGDGYITRAKKK
jgi:CoA:oxalate CoA-transferase